MKSYILVALQFILILFIALYCSVFGSSFSIALTIVSFLLGAWAVLAMRFHVSVFPEVKKGQKLYVGGPYRFMRHPMYSAVLLAAISWVSNRVDFFSLLAFVFLFFVLLEKIKIEEKQLMEKFPEYAEYIKKTKKFIPGIY